MTVPALAPVASYARPIGTPTVTQTKMAELLAKTKGGGANVLSAITAQSTTAWKAVSAFGPVAAIVKAVRWAAPRTATAWRSGLVPLLLVEQATMVNPPSYVGKAARWTTSKITHMLATCGAAIARWSRQTARFDSASLAVKANAVKAAAAVRTQRDRYSTASRIAQLTVNTIANVALIVVSVKLYISTSNPIAQGALIGTIVGAGVHIVTNLTMAWTMWTMRDKNESTPASSNLSDQLPPVIKEQMVNEQFAILAEIGGVAYAEKVRDGAVPYFYEVMGKNEAKEILRKAKLPVTAAQKIKADRIAARLATA